MPTAGAIRAGRAFVEIFADDSKLQRGLHAAQAKLKTFASSSMAIGSSMMAGATAAAMPLLGAVRQFMSVGNALDEMSSRMSVSVEFLSVLSHAASLSGTSIEALEVGVRKMQKTAYDAANGSKTAEEAFAALGISATDVNGDLKGTESLFMETTTALGNVANETEKALLAVALFGRSGTSLLPMLGSGAEGMRAMMEEAQRLGLVMSTRDAKAAAELADAWQGVTSSLKFATLQVGAALAPALTALATKATELLTPVIAWIRGNQWLVVSIAGVIAGVGALGATLVVVSVAANAAAATIGVVSTVLAAVMTPAGLLATALLTVAAALGTATGAWSDLLAGMKTVSADFTAAWGAIVTAIGSGDLAAAWGVVTALTKLEWTRVTTWLGESWAGIQILWNDLTSGLAVKMLGALATIKTAWAAAIGWMKKLWESWTSSNFMEGFTQGMLESLKAIPGMDTAFKMATGASIEDTQAQVTGVFAGRRKELPKRQAEIDAETKTRTDAIEADRKAGEDAIRQGQDQFNTARGNDVLDAQEELRLAKDRHDAALKKANEKPPEQEPSQGKKGPAAVAPEPEQVTQDKTTPVLGTFSAFEASRMGTDTAASRTADATEETARNTRLLRERREFAGVKRVFGVAINEAVPRPALAELPQPSVDFGNVPGGIATLASAVASTTNRISAFFSGGMGANGSGTDELATAAGTDTVAVRTAVASEKTEEHLRDIRRVVVRGKTTTLNWGA